MIDEIQSLMEQYLQWLKDKTALKQIDKDWVQVTTPHLDRHNDCLQFYIRKEANGFLLSDDRANNPNVSCKRSATRKKMQSKQRFSNGRIVVKTVRPIPNYLFCSIIAKRKSRLRRLTHLKITISNRFYGQNAAKL